MWRFAIDSSLILAEFRPRSAFVSASFRPRSGRLTRRKSAEVRRIILSAGHHARAGIEYKHKHRPQAGPARPDIEP
jgi:hypothetical protein